jgi:hypothetical protein
MTRNAGRAQCAHTADPCNKAVRRGNVFLKSALFAAASAAVRTKGSYYRDKYNRLRARRGPVRALMAIAHKLLVAASHMLVSCTRFPWTAICPTGDRHDEVQHERNRKR